MTAPRFFVSQACGLGAEIELESDDAHHAANVLRLVPGDRIIAIGPDGAWNADLTTVSKGRVRARPVAQSTEAGGELPVEVAVLQAVTKGAKFDEVIEKCVELGAHRIVPVVCARSYADATPARVERWRRIARAAAQQSRRRIIPFVDDPIGWIDEVRKIKVPVIVAWEGAMRGTLAAALAHIDKQSPLAIAVGPEGSFTEEELKAARDAKGELVSLGPTILRTETAAAALVAAVASFRGWW